MWVEGVGTPDGAPAEISLTVAGETISTYVWDPGSGVLLAMQAESRGKGTVSTMGLELPIELQSARSAELVP
jgi:hypothetical protein